MTDTPAQQTDKMLLGELVNGSLTEGECQPAQELHGKVLGWVRGAGNLEEEKRKTFEHMCGNKEFGQAYGILKRAFGENDSISVEQMQEWAQWFSFIERGFVPNPLIPK